MEKGRVLTSKDRFSSLNDRFFSSVNKLVFILVNPSHEFSVHE